MQFATIILSTLLLAPAPAARADSVFVANCMVNEIDKAQVAAWEPGVLLEVQAKEGDLVKTGAPLAHIDDTKTKMEIAVNKAKLAAAQVKATDEINIEFSRAATKVAEAAYEINAAANRRQPNTIPLTVLRESELEVTKNRLGIKKAQLDQTIATEEANVAKAELQAAEENLNRRMIRAPLNGVVVDVPKHKGEWVQPGDVVVQVVSIDRLMIDGDVNAKDYNPSEIEKRPVMATVNLARGQQIKVRGQIVFVSPMVLPGNIFHVRAEVNRPADAATWPLRPGMKAEMTIELR